jgi:hypothetical protein
MQILNCLGGSTIQTSYLPPAQGDEFGRRLNSLQPGDVININGASYTAVRKVATNRIDPVAAHGSANVRTTPSGYYQPPVATVNQVIFLSPTRTCTFKSLNSLSR